VTPFLTPAIGAASPARTRATPEPEQLCAFYHERLFGVKGFVMAISKAVVTATICRT
jgi:hypothetical protein